CATRTKRKMFIRKLLMELLDAYKTFVMLIFSIYTVPYCICAYGHLLHSHALMYISSQRSTFLQPGINLMLVLVLLMLFSSNLKGDLYGQNLTQGRHLCVQFL